jgi:hypothetical protein
MPYPPGWRRISGDPGTASAALLGGSKQFLGYLNLTPRQGAETLATWARFRVEHNADEGSRNITTLASGTGRWFRDATGSCVEDAYTTSSGTRYREIACLVEVRRTSVVIVGASPLEDWARVAPMLQRAIAGVTA